MGRLGLAVIVGLFARALMWAASDTLFAAVWPGWFGAHEIAFQGTSYDRGTFTADSTILLTHVVFACLISTISGYIAALIARETRRAPLILGCMVLGLGLVKATMSWSYVPLWYHVVFTAFLLPMTVLGGKFKSAA